MGATVAFPPAVGVPLTNCVFYAMAGSVVYAVYKNARGELPNEIPLISESVRVPAYVSQRVPAYVSQRVPAYVECQCRCMPFCAQTFVNEPRRAKS